MIPKKLPHLIPIGDDEFYLGEQWGHVPAGFITDLDSIPSIIRPLVRLLDTDRQARERRVRAIMHDWLYATQGKGLYSGRALSRSECDRLCFAGDPVVLAGLTLFGWHAWRKCRGGLSPRNFSRKYQG